MKFLVMALIPVVVYAQITMKTGSFQLNTRIDLTTGEYSNTKVVTTLEGQMEHPCSTSEVKKDLFLNSYYNPQSTAVCPSPGSAIGSDRPFYRFEKEVDSTDLDVSLNLDKTTLCTKVDTNYDNPAGNTCELPYFIGGNQFEGITLVVTTSDNKYALVFLTPTIDTFDCYSNTGDTTYHWTRPNLSGFNATWYIQANGTPLFQGITIPTGVRNPYRRYAKTVSRRAGYYSLLGRKMPLEQVRRKVMHHGTPSLYVVEDRGDTRLMLE